MSCPLCRKKIVKKWPYLLTRQRIVYTDIPQRHPHFGTPQVEYQRCKDHHITLVRKLPVLWKRCTHKGCEFPPPPPENEGKPEGDDNITTNTNDPGSDPLTTKAQVKAALAGQALSTQAARPTRRSPHAPEGQQQQEKNHSRHRRPGSMVDLRNQFYYLSYSPSRDASNAPAQNIPLKKTPTQSRIPVFKPKKPQKNHKKNKHEHKSNLILPNPRDATSYILYPDLTESRSLTPDYSTQISENLVDDLRPKTPGPGGRSRKRNKVRFLTEPNSSDDDDDDYSDDGTGEDSGGELSDIPSIVFHGRN